MCSRVQCRECGKPTWGGCGRHIEQALAGVPHEARCHCREERAQGAQRGAQGGTEASPAAGGPARKRLFGLF